MDINATLSWVGASLTSIKHLVILVVITIDNTFSLLSLLTVSNRRAGDLRIILYTSHVEVHLTLPAGVFFYILMCYLRRINRSKDTQ
jgi:hypothetical protein